MKESHPRTVGVLFVCMGNICRSPTGEGVFRAHVRQAGMDRLIDIDSAGTIAYHAGNPADARMRTAAAARGYRLESVARQVQAAEIARWDLIVPMDHENLTELEALAGGPRPHIRLLGSFLPGRDGNAGAPPVPDPYYGGSAGFERVLDMIESACPGMLEHCRLLLGAKNR